jgi:Peptidase family M50
MNPTITNALPDPWPLPDEIRPEPNLKRALWTYVGWIAFAFAAGLILFAALKLLVPPSSMKGKVSLLGMLAIVPIIYGVIVAHELGHLIGGKLAGMQLQMFAAGPVLITRSRDGMQLELNRHWQMWGGMVALTPNGRANVGRQLICVIAGGPLMSLLLGISLVFGAMMLPAGTAKFLMILGGITSCVIGAATLIPNTAASFPSDGRQILDLLRGGTLATQHQAMMRIIAADNAGTRPSDWSANDLHDLQQCDGVVPLKQLMAHWLMYFHWRDKRDLHQAAIALRQLLDVSATVNKMFRPHIAMEVADFLAHYTSHHDAAKAWIAEGDNKRAPVHLRHSARAAMAHVEGAAAVAAKEIELAKTALSKLPGRGYATAAADWLDALNGKYAP